MYRIVQIFYDDDSLKNCYINKNVALFYNPILTDYFENSVICELVPLISKYDYFGVWSHKHKFKVQGNGFNFDKLEKRLKVDVLAFQRFLRNGRIFSGEQERTYQKLFNQLMEELNLKYRFPNRPRFVVMQNHFIARSPILKEYIEKILSPAIDFMEKNNEYGKQVMYNTERKYTYKPFICEKLFSAFLNQGNYKCEHW